MRRVKGWACVSILTGSVFLFGYQRQSSDRKGGKDNKYKLISI